MVKTIMKLRQDILTCWGRENHVDLKTYKSEYYGKKKKKSVIKKK